MHSLPSSFRVFPTLALCASSPPIHTHFIRTPTLFTVNHRVSSFSTTSNIFSSSLATSLKDTPSVVEENLNFGEENGSFEFEVGQAASDLKNVISPAPEVIELEELPEQWRRSKLAWLCKELPSHSASTLNRILNGQKKWITQENATYIAVHFMRIRENEAALKVYRWMQQQRHWYRFDFDFVTKLADYMGKERKVLKCREIFDDIIKQGRVPSESTFHILIVGYLSATDHDGLDEACGVFNRMIQFGGYRPRLSLHNSLFKALVSKPGGKSKHYLKQAEFIFHNLVTSGLEVSKDIYSGLLWLHSYQDSIDAERIVVLRREMKQVGIEEGRDVLLSILRAYSKQGDVEEVEQTWLKLLKSDCNPPSQAFVYRMEVYANVGEPMKSLDVFRAMQEIGSTNVVGYHKIIEVMSKAKEIEIARDLLDEFIESGMKPLTEAYIDLMNMYLNLNLHEKLEEIFLEFLEKCNPNRTIFNIYLNSLVKCGNHNKAMEIFNQMYSNEAIGVNSRTCNRMLSVYLSLEQHNEAEKIYDLICLKKYDVDPELIEKLDFVLSLKKKVVKKPARMKLSEDQREILIGLLLGGLRIESDEVRKNHTLHFEFNESSDVHSVLKRHIYDRYHEWLNSFCRSNGENETIPHCFSTITHTCFGFYADQFSPKGRPAIPKLIHRWLSPRVLAFWYMYGGHRTASGDILLKLKSGTREDVEKIVMALKEKSLDCRVKRKGRVYWIGFFGSNSVWFWELTKPYIFDDLKELLRADINITIDNEGLGNQHMYFNSGSDSD